MMRTLITSLVVAVQFISPDSRAAEPVEVVVGQKLDSGLGGLPPYTEWYRQPHLSHLVPRQVANVLGEKLDSGLGDLPLYAQWDRHPELKHLAAPASPQAAGSGADEQSAKVTAFRH